MREMKDSGVEWIGEIPKDWKVIRLKGTFQSKRNAIKVGPFGSQIKGEDFVYKGVPVYNQRTVLDNDFENGDSFITEEKYQQLKGFTIEKGDVLITTRGTIGKVAIAPDSVIPGILHPCVIKFSIDPKIYNKNLLSLIFNNTDIVLEQLILASNATTIPVVYSEPLKNIYLPLANINEQQEMVNYLDSKCSKIDAIIARQEEIIEKLKEYKLSVITEAVTKGLDPDVEMKVSGVDYIGEIPSQWEIRKIKSITDRVVVGVVVRPSDYFDDAGTVPFLRGINVKEYEIKNENIIFISEENNKILNKSIVHTEDILVVRDGAIGVSCVVPPEYDGANVVSMIIIGSNKRFDSRFLCYSLNSQICKTQFDITKIGSALTHTSVSAVASLNVVMPEVQEQKQIADYLDKKVLQINKSINRKQSLVDKLKEYKKSLIYEVVTGKKEV